MIKNRVRDLVIFTITTGLILILNSDISFSQDTDTQNVKNNQLPCQKSESCVFLGDQYLFGIYTKVGEVTPRERAKSVKETIESISNNLLVDTNKIFTYESDTCPTDENDNNTCDAILAYITTDGKTENIIKFNQEDVTQINTQETINIKLPIDLADNHKKTIQTTINLYRNGLRDGRGNPFFTFILLVWCFILMFHQLFLNLTVDFAKDLMDAFSRSSARISKNFKSEKETDNMAQESETNDSPAKKSFQEIQYDFQVGVKRRNNENPIEEIYFLYPSYVIYRTKNTIKCYINEEHLGLEDEKPLTNRYNEVQSKLSEIESKQPSQIDNTETINIVVAHGLKLALDGKKEEAEKVFKLANQRLDNFRKKYNTLKYLNGSFTVVLCFLFAILSLAILPKLFPDLFYNIFTILGINTQFIPVIIYGSLGGFLSVSYRIRSAGLDIRDPDSNFRILGASRIYIAVISSIFIYAVLKADIISGTGTSLLDANAPEMSLFRIAFFSAIAGFVEGFVPDILDNSASKFSNNGKRNGDQNPENPPQGE